METKYHYTNVINALKELDKKGFVTDFNLHANEIIKNPNNYKIIDIYRNDGGNDPDEEATVYGIESIFGINTEQLCEVKKRTGRTEPNIIT